MLSDTQTKSEQSAKPLGAVRNLIWPIHNHEHKKFIPMLMMFFFISFDYNILRTMKDTLVVTAKNSGAEVIPFIKVWAMFPGAVLMTFVFTWLSNRMSKERVFYLLMSFFLLYFALFVFYLFPNHESLHFNASAEYLREILPGGFKGMITMFQNWTFTLFYVMSELWGNIILIVLFWGFVNQITKLDEAKRFYGLFGLGANISGIISGQVSVYLSRKAFNPDLPFGNTPWEQSLFMLVALVLLGGIATLVLFYWINKNVLTDERFICTKTAREEKALKGKLSLKDSFAHLLKSPYLLYIAIIVIGYNITINLCEVLWKDQIRILYPSPSDYNLYTNQVSTWVGVIATISALFVSGNAIRRCGWTFTALITPFVLLITSVLFFGLLFSRSYLEMGHMMIMGMTPLSLIVFVGAFQNVLSRGAKYTVFDATKEMAFVPLSTECKIKGKAAIDGVCNRLGKSGGSVIHQGLLIIFSSFAITAPYVAGILLVIIGAWMGAVRLLGKSFAEITQNESEPADSTNEKAVSEDKPQPVIRRKPALST